MMFICFLLLTPTDYSIKCSETQSFVCEVLNVTSADNGTVLHPPGKPCKRNSFRDKVCIHVLLYKQTYVDNILVH